MTIASKNQPIKQNSAVFVDDDDLFELGRRALSQPQVKTAIDRAIAEFKSGIQTFKTPAGALPGVSQNQAL